jgi:hypothetical protein
MNTDDHLSQVECLPFVELSREPFEGDVVPGLVELEVAVPRLRPAVW